MRRPGKPGSGRSQRHDAFVVSGLLGVLLLAGHSCVSSSFFLPAEPDSATARRAVATDATSEVAEWRRPPGDPKPEQRWGLWPALPIAPYERRVTLRYEVIPGQACGAT